jgi:3-methyladenine DNA glycosylase AlkC
MAKKFKDYYDAECARLIASRLADAIGSTTFDPDRFVREISEHLEGDPPFSARQDIFATALEHHLPGDYPGALQALTAILGPPLQEPEGMFTYGWWLWPIGRFVERNALLDRPASYRFIRELTRRFTGEFAIRPLLREEPEEAMEVLDRWSRDTDVHIRRCASEGMRIRLPWAKRLTVALDHFDRYRTVLGHLRQDPERFVQKSVGNNLNDLMKEAPDLAWELIREWEAELDGTGAGRDYAVSDGVAGATRWIIRHGTRSTRKRNS